MKRKSTDQSTATEHASIDSAEFFKKNLRSKIPRKKRTQISPILFNDSTTSNACLKRNFSFNLSCDQVSCNTVVESADLPLEATFSRKNVVLIPNLSLKKEVAQVSVSEHSCVESCSVVVAETESNRNDKVPTEFSAIQHSPASTTATVEQKTSKSKYDEFILGMVSSDLACSENFSYDEYEVSSATNVSELQSEIFSSDEVLQFDVCTEEYTPMWLNSFSGSQFSEKSSDDSTSPCYSLFKEIYQQFSQISSDSSDYEVSSLLDDQYSDELAFWKFEREEDEENYRRLRNRERNQATKARDYIEDYDFATDYGGLILEQRLIMANWIVELSRKKDLQSETTFLAVRLLDRFLTKGFFTSRKNLQLLGIACLTLAIRIEENQPYNSVQQKSFYVGCNVYCRYEVVAMEWVILEVLKFHCISPTTYSFLGFYLKAAAADEEMERKAKYLAGLSLLDCRHLRFWPSTVAAALVLLVSFSVSQGGSSLRVVQAHVRTKVNDLTECVQSLEWLLKYIC
ncbi:cyclin-SDS-like [Amaranthus tricolor]|uniref:cyclin-SDS-like n=1 Tax=Amaranthus tricolor TaxID=29722 RepID=UPI00258E9BC3|nr:cyclin-SDS-like [Amaranthus tricolor]